MNNNCQSNEDDSKRAEAVFFEALEFETTDEQNGYIQQRCAGDEMLRRQVDQLFMSLAAAEDLFAETCPLWISAEDLINTISNFPEFAGDGNSQQSDTTMEI